ncbi:hypothetical protein [Neobacillus vireti]|uniref:Uncharacterized protein n=1 Tax=Neobacillus vireti LMG 21834 TaxID=1131730 RepID=A0AB94IL53_9BACI|nr:hypothetical protein [Neobacillus vireti]ETI67750.1 hypothetical protein BAVI_15922 [Neobacillus vireti LMG 21834]
MINQLQYEAQSKHYFRDFEILYYDQEIIFGILGKQDYWFSKDIDVINADGDTYGRISWRYKKKPYPFQKGWKNIHNLKNEFNISNAKPTNDLMEILFELNQFIKKEL